MGKIDDAVCIIDDDPAVRKGLARLLRSAHLAVATYASAAEFLARADDDGVGCIVLDVRMPGLDGMSMQARLAALGDQPPIIFLTGHGDIPMSVQAMKQGAFDFLTKPVDEEVLLNAVHQALTRHGADHADRIERQALRARLESLTPREQEVLRLVITGALNKQIAATLGIAEKTVKIHRGRVMEKMEASSVAALMNLCRQVGIQPPQGLQTQADWGR